jgi:hypothetical protein
MNQKLLLCFVIIIIVIFIVSNNSELFTDASMNSSMNAQSTGQNNKAYTINLMSNNEKYDLLTFTQLSTMWQQVLIRSISAIDNGSLLKIIPTKEEYDNINTSVINNKPIMPTHDFIIAVKHKQENTDVINGNIVFNSNNDPIYTQDNITYTNMYNKALTINNNILVATDKPTDNSVVLSEGNTISGKYIELIDLTNDITKKSIYFIKLVDTNNNVTITKI